MDPGEVDAKEPLCGLVRSCQLVVEVAIRSNFLPHLGGAHPKNTRRAGPAYATPLTERNRLAGKVVGSAASASVRVARVTAVIRAASLSCWKSAKIRATLGLIRGAT